MDKPSVRQSPEKKKLPMTDGFEEEALKPQAHLSRIKRIYSSRDGLLGVYQDAEGHLVSVDTRNFSN